MTRVGIGSDIHLEFGPIVLKNTGNADILILPGDICVARDLEFLDVPHTSQYKTALQYMKFFEQISKEFSQVVYILGNHEHYRGDYKYTVDIIKRALSQFNNIHVLEKETYEINDITIVGATLWTDMNNSDYQTMAHVRTSMPDFRGVKNSNVMTSRRVPLYEPEDGTPMQVRNVIGYKFKEEPSIFSPQDSVEDHKKAVEYIKHVISNNPDKKYVVVTHHTPSWQSCSPFWINDRLMNGAFHTELGNYIVDKPQIKLWAHGHTHESFNYTIGETVVICNPRGYIGHERQANAFDLVYVDIE